MKSELLRMVRREFEQLPGEQQEIAAMKALKKPIFAWDLLTFEQLSDLYGATRATSLVWEQSP